jgi:hypothetical protein
MGPTVPDGPMSALSQRQQALVADLMRVRGLAAAHADTADAARTNAFLSAASRGDDERLREMLLQVCTHGACPLMGSQLPSFLLKEEFDLIQLAMSAGSLTN